MSSLHEWAKRYTSAVREYLAGTDETALDQAYELGRDALGAGSGLLEVAAVHQETLSSALAEHPHESLRMVRRFLALFHGMPGAI